MTRNNPSEKSHIQEAIYQRWEPVNALPERLYLEALRDDYEGFRLLLRGESPQSEVLKISFENYLCYRNLDESYYLASFVGKGGIFKSWALYTVQYSEFLAWFHRESLNIHEDDQITHYLVVTPNDMVEVLSCEPPVVEWL